MNEKTSGDGKPKLHSCGWPEDSFACKVRHIHMNTGDAKASKD